MRKLPRSSTAFGDASFVIGMKGLPLMVAAAVVAAGVGGALISSSAQSGAANTAADAQTAASQAGIAQQNQQFAAVQAALAPYQNAGASAIGQQGNLIGLNGNTAQQQAIDALQASPGYTSALQAGNNNILQNASATGGLRGGNTQAALAQFAPALLSSQINDQYNRLGGLTSLGQNAAAGVGNAGIQTGNQVTNLLQQQGAASAGAALAGGRATAGAVNSIAGGIGGYASLGGFGSFGATAPQAPAGTAGSIYDPW